MLRVALFQCNEVGKVVGRGVEEQMKKELNSLVFMGQVKAVTFKLCKNTVFPLLAKKF